MGIPRLITHLQPYASPVKLQRTLNKQNNHNNIQQIDNSSTAATTNQSTPPPAPTSRVDEVYVNGDENTDTNRVSIIIDGPAFAYHIYHLCKGHLYYRFARARAEARKRKAGRAKEKVDQEEWGNSNGDDASISALDVVPSYALLNAMARYWLGVLEDSVGVETV